MKKIGLFIFTALLLTLCVGCKSKRESLADEQLAAGNFKGAVQLYITTEEKGDISEEFYANISRALIGLMKEIAGRDPLSEAITNYTEEIPKYLKKSGDAVVIGEYGIALAEIATKRIEQEEYIPIVQGFSALQKTIALMDTLKVTSHEFNAAYSKLCDTYAAQKITASLSETDNVRAEYFLLEAANILPEHVALKEALNSVRLKNRGNFLIFSADVNDIIPNPLIDKYSFILAFPTLTVGATKTEGELQMWNTSGNAASFKAEDIILVSTTGTETRGKRINGNCDKIDNERDCALWVSFSYESGFIPDYVMVKFGSAEGRKYLGTK